MNDETLSFFVSKWEWNVSLEMNQIYLKSLDINNIVIPLFIEDPRPGRQGDRPKCTHLRGLQHLTQIEQI